MATFKDLFKEETKIQQIKYENVDKEYENFWNNKMKPLILNFAEKNKILKNDARKILKSEIQQNHNNGIYFMDKTGKIATENLNSIAKIAEVNVKSGKYDGIIANSKNNAQEIVDKTTERTTELNKEKEQKEFIKSFYDEFKDLKQEDKIKYIMDKTGLNENEAKKVSANAEINNEVNKNIKELKEKYPNKPNEIIKEMAERIVSKKYNITIESVRQSKKISEEIEEKVNEKNNLERKIEKLSGGKRTEMEGKLKNLKSEISEMAKKSKLTDKDIEKIDKKNKSEFEENKNENVVKETETDFENNGLFGQKTMDVDKVGSWGDELDIEEDLSQTGEENTKDSIEEPEEDTINFEDLENLFEDEPETEEDQSQTEEENAKYSIEGQNIYEKPQYTNAFDAVRYATRENQQGNENYELDVEEKKNPVAEFFKGIIKRFTTKKIAGGQTQKQENDSIDIFEIDVNNAQNNNQITKNNFIIRAKESTVNRYNSIKDSILAIVNHNNKEKTPALNPGTNEQKNIKAENGMDGIVVNISQEEQAQNAQKFNERQKDNNKKPQNKSEIKVEDFSK